MESALIVDAFGRTALVYAAAQSDMREGGERARIESEAHGARWPSRSSKPRVGRLCRPRWVRLPRASATGTTLTFALAIHGGAWNIPDGAVNAHRRGLVGPLTEGFDALRKGASALDVVELVVRQLEDDPTFNAGRGSHLNSAGELQMDASIMEGTTRRAGAVAAIDGVAHPVSVARRVMDDSPHVLLVGAGAKRFARDVGAEMCATRSMLVGRELARFTRIRAGDRSLVATEFSPRARPHGTVGAVALDRKG